MADTHQPQGHLEGVMSTDMANKSKKKFILYDGRAKFGVDTDDCCVLDTASSEAEAWRISKSSQRRMDGIWFEYEQDGRVYTKEKPRPDIGKGYLLP